LFLLTVLCAPKIYHEFGWSRGTIGAAVSLNLALYGLTAPFAAALMDRFGIRRVVAVALTVIAVGSGLTVWMTAAWQLWLCWGLLVGLGSGSMALAFAATVTNRWFTERRGLVSGILTAASASGQLIFLPILSWTVQSHGWRPAAVTVALAALAVVPFVWLLLHDHPADVGVRPYGACEFVPKPEPVTGAARRSLSVLASAVRTGPFWLLAGTFAISGASTNGLVQTHFVPAAHDHGMPVTAAASLLAVIGVFDVVGTIASGWFTDRFEPRRLLAVYYALRGVSLLHLLVVRLAAVHPDGARVLPVAYRNRPRWNSSGASSPSPAPRAFTLPTTIRWSPPVCTAWIVQSTHARAPARRGEPETGAAS
jgi:MFS family permease